MKISTLIVAATTFSALATGVLAQEYPLTMENRFGTTVIPEKPSRVVTLSYNGPDNLLALGVKPLAVRYWWGDYPFAIWPWAQEALGDAEPVVLTGEDGINIEQVAALQPDLIIALYSGISDTEYELLSQIAPTVANEAQYADYSTPWHVRARTIAMAVGESEKAEELITAFERRLANIAAAHPEWQGMTVAVTSGSSGVYRSVDPRPNLISQLGFVVPAKIDDLADADDFYVELSPEDLSPIDTDLVIWMTYGDGDVKEVRDMPLRKTLTAHAEGREVLAEELIAGAFSWASLLSLPYVLDELVPLIELAADGDPATIVPSSQIGGLLD